MKVRFEPETEEWSFDAFAVVDGHLGVEEAIDVVVDFAGLGYVGVVVVADDLIQQNGLLQWRGSRLGRCEGRCCRCCRVNDPFVRPDAVVVVP